MEDKIEYSVVLANSKNTVIKHIGKSDTLGGAKKIGGYIMEKVFIVVKLYCVDGCVSDITTLPFLDKQKAIDEVKSTYAGDLEDCAEKWKSDDYYKEVDLDNGYFTIYKEGGFTDDGYEVTIHEHEVE